MSYDYSSSNQRLELPNPYRLQNRCLFACGAALTAAGLWALWISKATLAPGAIAMGLGLLAAGVLAGATAAKRLRFFFGRGRPASLAPEVAAQQTGNSPAADYYKNLLREGALVYPEPKGAIEGVLYHWAPDLITAPLAVQQQAKVHFFNLAALGITALSFVFAWLIFGTEASRPWLALGYFAFGVMFLIRPITSANAAPLSLGPLVGLIAAAVIAPALIGQVSGSLPEISQWSLAPQTTVFLLSSLCGVALTMAAAIAQVQPPPPTATSSEQLRLSMNVPPGLLMDELERHMQDHWTERIPNRRYALSLPVIDPLLHSGPFSGELLEESQPMPMSSVVPTSLSQAFASKRHRWIAMLDLYASGLMLAALVCACLFAASAAAPIEDRSYSLPLLGSACILVLVSRFCLQAAAMLWGRFDFESTLTWVEMAGTYQTASIGTGNAMRSQIQTSNQVVRTEAMTLRVWRARLESVVFGKDSMRQVAAMFSTDAQARELAQHLSAFGSARSAMVAPESSADLAKLQTIGAAERLVNVHSESQGALLGQAEPTERLELGSAPAPTGSAAGTKRFCHACGAACLPQARFCSACGAALGD
jgi:hypothetical protein